MGAPNFFPAQNSGAGEAMGPHHETPSPTDAVKDWLGRL